MPVGVRELDGLDLRQPNYRDVAGVAPRRLAHRLVSALRLEQHTLEGRPALHRGLADVVFLDPHALADELAGLLVFARLVHKLGDKYLGVEDDPEVERENTTDLGGFNVGVDEPPSFAENRRVARHTVDPAVADPHHGVQGQRRGVHVLLGGLSTDRPLGQDVAVGSRIPAHKDGDHQYSKHFHQVGEGA